LIPNRQPWRRFHPPFKSLAHLAIDDESLYITSYDTFFFPLQIFEDRRVPWVRFSIFVRLHGQYAPGTPSFRFLIFGSLSRETFPQFLFCQTTCTFARLAFLLPIRVRRWSLIMFGQRPAVEGCRQPGDLLFAAKKTPRNRSWLLVLLRPNHSLLSQVRL